MTDNIRCPWDRPTPWEQSQPPREPPDLSPTVVRRVKDKENK